MKSYIDTVELNDLVFDNEFDWSPVEAVVEKTLAGNPIIWEQAQAGRPIDLVGTDTRGYLSRSTIESLYNLASVPNAVYTLSYGGSTYTVRFRNEDQPVISAKPIGSKQVFDGTEMYVNVRIKLMEV